MKITKKNTIDLQDWDSFVQKTYGRQYCFQQQDGCKERGTFDLTVPSSPDDYENPSIPETLDTEEMGVCFASWLARDPKKPLQNQKSDYELEMWWDRNFYPNIHMIANDLYEKGLLEAGDYTIIIDW